MEIIPSRYLKLGGCLAATLILSGFTGPAQKLNPPGPAIIAAARTASPGPPPGAPAPSPATPEEARQVLQSREKTLPPGGEARLAALVELARWGFIGGLEGDKATRRQTHAKGQHYAELLVAEYPRRVEGYYWLALNLGGLAEIAGIRQGLAAVPRMVDNLEKAVNLDEAYDAGGPHRVLGRIYFEAPRRPLSVGDLNKSLTHLERAVRLAPQNSTNHLYLGETLIRLGKSEEGCRELEQVLTAPHHAISPLDLAGDRRDAQALLKKYKAASP